MSALADVKIKLLPAPSGPPLALVWCKQTFKITPAGLTPLPAELAGDPLDDDDGLQLEAGPMDLWPHKQTPDLIVRGAAHAPRGVPARRIEVLLRAGKAVRRVAVFGRRRVSWPGGRPHLEAPEPFLSMPMTWENAYGGVDWRVPTGLADDPFTALRLKTDHPGLFPRNPLGKGYLVCPDPVDSMELPNLEDPDDLLTPERLITGRPERWYRQPLPACFEAAHPVVFPRCCFFAQGCQPWFPAPEDRSCPEVSRGLLPRNFSRLMADHALELGPHPRFFQEAAPGLTLPGLLPGVGVEVWGMHPALPSVRFTLPAFPGITLFEAGVAAPLRPVLHTVLFSPDRETVSMTFGAHTRLCRAYVPGLHREIPVSVSVAGQEPRPYQPPTPVRDLLMTSAQEERHA